jgi:hypothetical protein
LVLIAAARWWPLSARLASALMRHGCRVSALCPAGHPLLHISGLARIRRYSGWRSLACLRSAIEAERPDIIVPCDDGVIAQLHALHAAEPAVREVIERSLGAPESFAVVASRYRLLYAARELGIAVPETRRILRPADLAAWHEHVAPAGVLKVDGKSGGNGVRMCFSIGESMAAWREFIAPRRFATALKRLLIDGETVAMWARRGDSCEITMQRLVDGRPANAMLACRGGEVLSMVSVAVLHAESRTGASTIVQRIRDARMERAAKLLAAHLRLTGFYGLDFMIETGSGTPYLIELNPRCTQLGHLEFADQGSLAAAFSAATGGPSRAPPVRAIPGETVAFYPQALQTLNGGSRYAGRCYLDMPRDEPQLAAELKLKPPPQRRVLARIYHSMRRVNPPAGVEYEPHDASPQLDALDAEVAAVQARR